MDLYDCSSKDIGALGEKAAAEYLRRNGFTVLAMNVRVKFGELDIVARKGNCLHIIEVKSLRCNEFPLPHETIVYDPGENLHSHKLQKVVRTAMWYVSHIGWEGQWQIDVMLVWLRQRDAMARVRYIPQIL